MFAQLIKLSRSEMDHRFNLIPPFIHTDIGEIGNWTIREQAVSQKRVIHLTSGIEDVIGGVCQRIPTIHSSWVTDLEISLNQDSFIFSFSKYVCPNIFDQFDGINISFIPENNSSLLVRISEGGFIGSFEGRMQFSPFPNKTHIKITKNKNFIKIETGRSIKPVVQYDFKNRDFMYGYISLFAISPIPCNNCITNLHSLLFFNQSDSISFPNNISLINRKYLSSTSKSRQELKKKRRNKMITVSNYINQSRINEDILFANENQRPPFHDSLKEIKEMTNRAQDCMSAKRLTQFIDQTMMPTIEKAAKRYENVASALWQMKSEMNNLWDNTKKELRKMNNEVKSESFELKNDAEMQFGKIAQILNGMSKEPSFKSNLAKSHVEHFMAMFCLVEFLCFGYFLSRDILKYRHHKYV